MTRPADLEKNSVLPLELNLSIVQTPREKHRAINSDQGLAVKALILRCLEFSDFYFGLSGHQVYFAQNFAADIGFEPLYRIGGRDEKKRL